MNIRSNVSLKDYHTFGIDVKAAHFAAFDSAETLNQVLIAFPNHPLFILGGGSNVVFTSDFEGVVLHNQIFGKTIVEEGEQEVVVEAGAGESWHKLVLWCLNQGFGGIENLSLIPGSVGAAPIQNIGAYGVELKDIFEELEAVKLATGDIKTFDAQTCAFGYRDSIFKKGAKGRYCITKVRLRLRKKKHQLNTDYGAIQKVLLEKGIAQPTIQDVSKAVIEIRSAKLPNPAVIGNAGSFFKNPELPLETFKKLKTRFPTIVSYPLPDGQVKVPAGWLIEQTGWKGQRKGNVGCYYNQALVLVNLGDAKGHEVADLAKTIQHDVFEKFGIQLTREVNLV